MSDKRIRRGIRHSAHRVRLARVPPLTLVMEVCFAVLWTFAVWAVVTGWDGTTLANTPSGGTWRVMGISVGVLLLGLALGNPVRGRENDLLLVSFHRYVKIPRYVFEGVEGTLEKGMIVHAAGQQFLITYFAPWEPKERRISFARRVGTEKAYQVTASNIMRWHESAMKPGTRIPLIGRVPVWRIRPFAWIWYGVSFLGVPALLTVTGVW
ncbi:hypothetical protein VR010_11115 [Actinomycetaceae bacterium L2_0104]